MHFSSIVKIDFLYYHYLRPITSAYLLLRYDSIHTFIEYVFYTLLDMNNIFGALLFVFCMNFILKIK